MTTDEENLILNNIEMAYDLSWKYCKRFNNHIPIDELQSLTLLGLTKAAKTFKIELDNTFATYAYKVMQNEVLMYLKQYNKHKDVKSLSEEVNNDFELQDSIASDIDILEDFLDKATVTKLYNEIYKLKDRYRIIILYKLQGLTMTEIGNKLGVCQSQISRDYNKALNILRDKFKGWEEY